MPSLCRRHLRFSSASLHAKNFFSFLATHCRTFSKKKRATHCRNVTWRAFLCGHAHLTHSPSVLALTSTATNQPQPMGKCVRIRGSKPPSPGEAAAYLTLRSGRRVPVAAAATCSPPGRRRSSRGSACRGCGATATAKRTCGSPGRRKSAELPRPAFSGGAGRPEEELPTPPQASPVARDGDRGDSSE
jgi:hypothetical protein